MRNWRVAYECERLMWIGALGAVAVAPAPAQVVTLSNQTVAAGLNVTHAPAEDCISHVDAWMTGGLAVGDFNRDAWQDLFWISGGTGPDRLFINNHDGTFTDHAEQWGLTATHGGNGVSVADFNDDGWPDLYVTSFGNTGGSGEPGSHRLYRHQGNPVVMGFSEVAVQAGVNYTSPVVATGYGSAAGDYDLDGDLDLAVASWTPYGEGNLLYRNDGNGTFTNVTATALGGSMVGVWGFQPAFADMDGDGYPELLMAADFLTSRYMVNNRDGTFTDMTMASGTGIDENGMGQTVGDFNLDGLLDWYVTAIFEPPAPPANNPGNMLYFNLGNHEYSEISHPAGVNNGGFGWGAVAVDLDQDGWQEIVEVNGADHDPWIGEREYLFYNLRNPLQPTFLEIGEAAGLDSTGSGKGIVIFDADNDGDQDLAISNNGGPLEFYRNDTDGGAWLRIFLNTNGNPLLAPMGMGARVEVTANGNTYVRYVNGSPSYLATSEISAHFGLGSATIVDEIRVKWPRGYVTVQTNVPVNQHRLINAPAVYDLTADGLVNVADLLILLGDWGPVNGVPSLRSDVNNDGTVNVADLLVLLGAWTL